MKLYSVIMNAVDLQGRTPTGGDLFELLINIYVESEGSEAVVGSAILPKWKEKTSKKKKGKQDKSEDSDSYDDVLSSIVRHFDAEEVKSCWKLITTIDQVCTEERTLVDMYEVMMFRNLLVTLYCLHIVPHCSGNQDSR